jgi:type I restriction enzyme S subunit
LHEYLQKGFSINDEALKNMGGGLYWKELLERIRDIRSSINGNNLSNGEIAIKPETKRVTISEYQKYKKELNNRTILVSINGTLGNIAVYRAEKVILGKSACYFNVIDEVDKTFMKYIVSTDVFRDYILRYANGTTIKNVSLKVMREYPFMLPPLPTQRAIAATLSCLDDKIELNNRINANLEAQAQAIFKSWFVDFEPWGGKQPSNWQNYTLGNWLRFINGFAFKSSTYLDIGIYKVITIKNVQDGWVNSAKANCANKLPEGLNPACILS